MRSALNDFIYQKNGIQGILHIIILMLSLFLVVSISIDTFKNISFLNQPEFVRIELWICIFFLFDYCLEFFLSKNKLRYLGSRMFFLVISIPYVYILQHYHVHFSADVTYFLRFVPLLRGAYALVIVVGWLSSNRATGLFMSYLLLLASTVYFASMVFFVIEHRVNPMVVNYDDALWWACMDVTTVGCNISAATPVGRILSVLLAALGMMMFPIFTVYVTDMVQKANSRKEAFYKKKQQVVSAETDNSVGEQLI